MFAYAKFPKLVMLALALAAMLSGNVVALMLDLDHGMHEISITILPGEDVAYVVPMEFGDHLNVNLQVTGGGPADFYLTDATAYSVYKASILGKIHFDSFYYVAEYSDENASSISYSYSSLKESELVVLIDNSGYIQTGVAPTEPVSVEGTISLVKGFWTPVNLTIATTAIVAAVASVVFLVHRRRR